MNYHFFLFTNLVREYYPSYYQLEYDLLFEKLTSDFKHFEKSVYNSPLEGLYECICKYLDNNPYRYTKEEEQ